jgi:hypothetical protein
MLTPTRTGTRPRFGGQVAQAAHGLGHHTKARLVAIGAGLAVAADAQHDQARVELQKIVWPQTPALHRAGAEVLDQHIRVCGEAAHDVLRGRVFQVQRHRALVARLHLPPDRGAVFEQPPFAQRVARAGCLNLDHIGAEIRQRLGRERPGDQLPEFEDLEAGKRAGCRGGRFNIWDLHGGAVCRGPFGASITVCGGEVSPLAKVRP